MGIQITADQVIALAPDKSSAAAGKKLGVVKTWTNLGQNAEALWGECKGSALYQVRVEISTLSVQCSCPSRKHPCKHGLGLLLITANLPDQVPASEPPEWVVAWLSKKAATAKRKETLAAKPDSPPSAAQTKTIAKRKAQVDQGIERLDLWLNDLVRNGLGTLEAQPASFWEKQAQQMVDSQAPGLASRVRAMADIPNASRDWPVKLLVQCGQLALLTQAYSHLDQLDAGLQEDVRQMIGWNVKEDEVLAQGQRVKGDWLFLGQVVEEIERGKAQATWLLETTTRRSAMILQFAIMGSAFSTIYPFGVRQQADLVYWPGASPQRALIAERHGEMTSLTERLPGHDSIDAFFAENATLLARQPWQRRFLCVLRDVIPLYQQEQDQWLVRDSQGQALPMNKGEYWRLLALSGGQPLDLASEWNGETLSPLGALVENTYHKL